MQFFKTPNIDFVSRRRIAYMISSSLIFIGFVAMILRGGPNWGIDFKGGTSITLRFNGPVNTQQIRDALAPIGLGSSEIKTIGSHDEYVIYAAQMKDVSASGMTEQILSSISAGVKNATYEVRQIDTVGPKIGEELRRSQIMAVLLSLLLILIYVGWRFELVFAVGAILALFHDVFITLGFFAIFNMEISFKEIAAFLTIVGYSLNDTIVVYDRIRENLKIMRNDELPAIINKSINQVLGRTLITSLTTLFVVVTLFLIGGPVVRGFSFAMMVGIVIGTYSSDFVASPIVLEWQMRHGGKQHLKMASRKK